MGNQTPTIYDLGFGKAITRNTKIAGFDDGNAPSSSDLGGGLALLPNSVTNAVQPGTIQSGPLTANLEQKSGTLFNVKSSFTDTTAGYRMGIDESDGLFKFLIGNSTNSMYWNGSTLAITGAITATTGTIGGFTIGSDYIRDAANSFGLASTVSPTSVTGSISTRTANLVGISGLTIIQNANADDANIAITLPFSVTFNGVSYTTVYVGSNGYLTFGAGSSAFSGLSASNPAIPGIHINAGDRSYQRVYKGSDDGNITYRIRYEGSSTTSGTPGSSTVFWEITFSSVSPSTILIDVGSNAASGSGTSGVTSGSTYFLTIASATANTGYTISYDVDDVRFWAGSSFANRATAPARITEAGVATFTSGAIGGWTLASTSISSTGIKIASGAAAYIAFGATPPTSATVGTGIFIDATGLYGLSANTQNFKISATNGSITSVSGTIAAFTIAATTISATNLTLTSGAANTANISVGTGSNLAGLNSGNAGSDIAFWAGDTFANRATAAFRVTLAGALVATSATITGAITATSGAIGGWTINAASITGTGVTLSSAGNASIAFGTTPPTSPTVGTGIYIDKTGLFGLNANTQNFKIDATNGNITAISGTIGGWTLASTTLTATSIVLDSGNQKITVGSGSPNLVIDGANNQIGTSTFVSGQSGWRITGSGNAEFNNIVARGEFRTAVFVKDEVHATGGTMIVLTASTLYADATTVTTPTTSTLDIQDPPSGHAQLFSVNDILRIKDGSGKDNWLKVTAVSDQTTFYRYTVDKQSGTNGTFYKGTAVVNYKQSTDGFVLLTSDLSNGPYIDIGVSGATPWAGTTAKARLGNLGGITDATFGALSGYGLWTSNGYFTGSVFATAGYFGDATTRVAIEAAGITVGTTGSIRAGQTAYDTGTGFWIGQVTGTPKFSIGNSAGNKLTWDGSTLSITGTLTASAGAIGGFSIGTDYIRDAANSFGLASTVTGGDDVRFWAGDTFANRATAAFRVTEAGVFVATSATITGSITASSGAIGGFTIGATTVSATNLTLTSGTSNVANISVGTGSNLGGLNAGNAGTDVAFWAGDTYANRASAPFRVLLNGSVTMTSATISGVPLISQGTFGGDGSDGALSSASGTTSIDVGGAAYYVKNYTSISLTGTATVVFTNPHASGTIIIIKCQGACTMTTSAVAFNASGMGAASTTNASYIFDTLTHNGTAGSDAGASNGAGGAAGVQLGLTTVYLFQQHKTFIAAPGAGGGSGGSSRYLTGGFEQPNGAAGGAGGRGGGVLIFECNGAWNFTTGSLSVAGSVGGTGVDAANATISHAGAGGGGGGGGAGGMIGVLYKTLTADSGTYTVSGGAGGAGGVALDNNGTGGGSGGGAGSWAAAGSAGSTGNCSNGNPNSTGGAGAAGLAIRQKNITFA